jgi:pilus assembly protein FimV
MKYRLRIASAALLAVAAAPAWALQLGQIQVKSALNQPLVAAIPLHPKTLSELDGLTVGLASPEDFTRAGLQRTPTDQTLRFRVVSDNNGQKLILVTSTQPVSDPYLDFLLQVNTRQGKQVREFVVLLNPVIEAPAPAVQTAPVAGAPVATPRPPVASAPPAELPSPQVTPEAAQQPLTPAPQPKAERPPQPAPKPQPQSAPQPHAKKAQPTQARSRPQPPPAPQPKAHVPPKPQPAPKPQAVPPPAPPPAQAAHATPAAGRITVKRGDTLYGIASDASHGTGASINQMMIALQSANPEAFFKDNINNLKAGAILRIPTRDEIDKIAAAEATADVHHQYETWHAAKPHPATVVEGTAAQAAARSAPKPEPEGQASDHLTLVPPTGGGTGTGSRPGVAGGTGNDTVAGLQQRLQTERGTLASLTQSNTDLESRVQSLKDIAGKSDKLLSFKEATIAELQRKLAAVQSGQTVASAARQTGAGAAHPAPRTSSASAAGKTAATPPQRSPTAWFERPVAWIVAGAIVLALILAGLLWRRRRGGTPEPAEAHVPLSDPEDVTPQTGTAAYAATLQAQLVENPDDLGTHLALCRLYHAQGDAARFVAAAEAMHEHVHDAGSMEWHEVAVMGEELAPGDPLFAPPAAAEPSESPAGPDAAVAEQRSAAEAVAADPEPEPEAQLVEPIPNPETGHEPWHAELAVPAVAPAAEAQPEPAYAGHGDATFHDDPVDTKLDLARAYLDMGDPVGARAMLDEVIEEGSQMQQDEARRLLADTAD